ncbi:SGNH/GDSL hydrolase family protein [Arthrobacter sp. TWP1-1]|uniref:SGNH/GDSL hydrolase family protein n=1 Tax=Arthrobacter sp. TWP1-1 TaxID=2804568 RepID=UPI003CF5D44B
MRTHTFRKVAARTVAAAVVSGGLIFGFSGLPATAAPPPAGTYTVIGDSYSAGSGGDFVGRPCLQSPYGYGDVFATANGLSFENLACHGATINQVLTQVSLIPTSTRLVSLTVGGNDVGSGQVAAACLSPSLDCQRALAEAQAQLALLPAKVKGLTKSIRAKVPRAQIVYMGYPHLFEVGNLPPQLAPLATTINATVDQLNAVLAQSAVDSGARFVSVTGYFDGHGYPSGDSWLIPPLPGLEALAFHPTAAGYANGYAAALQNTKLSPPLYAGVWR